ncbi:MAG: cellulase family glycosylhydrolase, partial [Chloroflexota bacterium]
MKRLSVLTLLFAILLSGCQSAITPTPVAPTATQAEPTAIPSTATPTEIPPTPTREPLPPLPEGFVHAKGRDLVIGESQTPIRLTGVNFAAYGWGWGGDTPKDVYNAKDFRQEDYFRVADMGMNVVRLNVWYQLFEHDYYPYVYDKPEGWQWLDQQIAWAKEARVYIILSMMRPQGDYQGPDYEGPFWEEDPYYRDRLEALWVEIATRYKDETQIAAYDLINEPYTNERSQLWIDYAQVLTDAIRTVDSNHLLDIQQELSVLAPFMVNDPAQNVMYDMHFYDPYYYTTQFANRSYQGKYGDPLTPIMPWDWELEFSEPLALAKVPEGDSDWALYESEAFLVDNEEVIGAQPVFVPSADGKVIFDDLFVTEYAPDGSSQVLMNIALENNPPSGGQYFSDTPYTLYNWNLLPTDDSGQVPILETTIIAHDGYSSFSFPTAFAAPRLIFPVKRGYSYSVSGWMKGEGVSGEGGLTLRWADWMYGGMIPLTKENLEQRLLSPEGDYNL